MSEPSDLLAQLSDDRFAADRLAELFTEWWPQRDNRAHELLDALALTAAADEDALELLLRLIDNHGLSRPALRRVLIDADDVADAEQSTLAVVAMKVGQYNGTARFSTWLHQVASNESKMLIRARDRRPSTAVAEPDVAPFVARLSTMLADRDTIERALAALPDDFRRPLELREFDGLDYDEIASTLNVPVGTVRSRLSRARSMLVANLRAEMADE